MGAGDGDGRAQPGELAQQPGPVQLALAALPADVELPAPATLLAGTERVSPELVARFAPGRRMFDAYGPTEATVNSTLWPAQPGWAFGMSPHSQPLPQAQAEP